VNEGADSGRSLTTLPLPERLEALRARMSAVPSRVGSSSRAEVQERDVLPILGELGQLLPDHGLVKGSVVMCSGSSLMLGLLAAVTGAKQLAAVVGCRRMGLLAAAEMGADLSRLFHIPQPGEDPLAVLAVLLDGLDLVVFDLAGASVPPSRSRALIARVRSHRSVLVVTGGDWVGSDLRLKSRPAAYSGLGCGHGRLRSIHLDVQVSGKGLQPRTGRLVLAGSGPNHTSWTLEAPTVERQAITG
jgi:hypothetical protein